MGQIRKQRILGSSDKHFYYLRNRLGEIEEAQALYKEFGDFLKTNCTGPPWRTAFIYTGNPELRKSIGLKTTKIRRGELLIMAN